MKTSDQRLKALIWKSDQMNISYGKLRSMVSEADIRKICQEYSQELAERQSRERERMSEQSKK